MSDSHDSNSARNAGTMLALMGLIAVGFGLLLLVLIVLPLNAMWLIVVVFGFFFVGIFHYVTWGRRMLRMRVDEEDEQE